MQLFRSKNKLNLLLGNELAVFISSMDKMAKDFDIK